MSIGDLDLWLGLFTEIDKRIAAALARFRPNLAQSTGSIPSNQLPPADTTNRGGVTFSSSTPAGVTTGAGSAGSSSAAARADHVHSFAADMATQAELDAHAAATSSVHGIANTALLMESGDAAGGDLSGVYPNPTVAQLQGQPVASTLPTNGYALVWDSTAGEWGPAAVTPSFASQTANHVLAGPTSGGAAAPSFRALVAADLPAEAARKDQANTFTAAQSITSTGTPLTITATAASGQEVLLHGSVSDDATAYFEISNGASADNSLVPLFRFRGSSTTIAGQFIAEIATDSGATPACVFDARGVGVAITTRPLFDWRSLNTSKMMLTAGGNLLIGTTTDNSHKLQISSGTSVAIRLDGSGNTASAGSNAASLGNRPNAAAGNSPATWIAVSIAGTTRYIPAW